MLARFSIHADGRVKPYLLGGPQVSLLLSAELRESDGTARDIKNQSSAIDVALIFGAGLLIEQAAHRGVTIEVRGEAGLLNIEDSTSNDVFKNRGMMLLLGYQY